jgi:DNA-binding NarL/FixJ family response regulator
MLDDAKRTVVPSYKILVVEDFAPFRRFICSELRERPEFQIIETSDGLEAVQMTAELRPDLIVLDIGLPNLNGIEVARRVRKLAPASKILFVTQLASPDVVQQALSFGALGFVDKSRAYTDLFPAIDAALRNQPFVSSNLKCR